MPQLETMVPGGKWIKPPGESPVTYVVHEAHIKRLYAEGGEPVPDPRPSLAQHAPQVPTQPDALEAAMHELAALKAQMAQLLAEKGSTPDASTPNHVAVDSPRPAHDIRPGKR